MKTFLAHRDDYLAVQMILKGRGEPIPQTCPTCLDDVVPVEPTFRCLDCFFGALVCQDCCVESHKSNPLHRIQVWNGTYFERVSLRRLGLVVQLDHPDGSEC
ncbi:hypothetical protein K435DRAFT_698016, partial [Dendrothele bispora CBS 962.96]